ncbi:MAG: hypothetical protein J5990_09885 [Bacteroidales bacterium]|nr:hypothetical protein [Bacteroidales bacterium]
MNSRKLANMVLLIPVAIIFALMVLLMIYALVTQESSECISIIIVSAAGILSALCLGAYIWKHRNDSNE